MKAIQDPTTIFSRTANLKIQRITKILTCGDNRHNQQFQSSNGENLLFFHDFKIPNSISIIKFYKTKGRFALCQTASPDTILIIGQSIDKSAQTVTGEGNGVFHLKKFDSPVLYAAGGLNFFSVLTSDNKVHMIEGSSHDVHHISGVVVDMDTSYDMCFIQTADGVLYALNKERNTVIYDSKTKPAAIEWFYMGADHGYALLENDSFVYEIDGNINHYFDTNRTIPLDLQQDESVLQMSVTYYTTTVLTSKNRVYFLNTKNRSGPERPMGAGQVAWLENSVKQVHAVVTVDGKVEVVGENAYGECALGHASSVKNWTDISDKIAEHKAPNEKILQFVLSGWTTYVVLGELQEWSLFSQTYHTGTHQKRNQFADIELICM